MIIKKSLLDGGCKFSLTGKFTFSDHQNFRTVIETIKSDGVEVVELDLGGLEYLDSAALGMFLVAKQETEKNNCRLYLSNPVGHVKNMFELSNFNTLFEIR